MDWSEVKRELLRDPETAREYAARTPQRELARSIIRLRLAKGWTQQQLAEHSGTKQPAISRLESMDAKPSLSMLQRVAAALDAQVVVRLEPKQTAPKAKARSAKKGQSARRPVRRRVAA
jgi:transcriptional regulator with XRE-family HTH domain